jgi:hypothetical protein
MRVWVTLACLLCGIGAANARNVYCHPGAPSVEWDGQRWQMAGYSGPLSEVSISNNFGQITVTCVRSAIQMSAFPKGKCHFKAGTKTSVRTYKRMEWSVCKTDKDMNVDECAVECDD